MHKPPAVMVVHVWCTWLHVVVTVNGPWSMSWNTQFLYHSFISYLISYNIKVYVLANWFIAIINYIIIPLGQVTCVIAIAMLAHLAFLMHKILSQWPGHAYNYTDVCHLIATMKFWQLVIYFRTSVPLEFSILLKYSVARSCWTSCRIIVP